MSGENPNSVQAFIDDLQLASADKAAVLFAVRDCFLSCDDGLEEAIKYGGLVFLLDGDLLGGIFVYKAHVSVEFSHDATFDDPEGVLEGSGKYRRHIKLVDMDDIHKKKLPTFIEQALSV